MASKKAGMKFRDVIRKIHLAEEKIEKMKSDDFSAKTSVLRMKAKSGESLDDLLPEAFALVRVAIRRVLGLEAFDVQLMGAIVAHKGDIVEMRTGEGKTLTIIFPAFLNALKGSVHVVTVNDYLAERDAHWMRKVYKYLGLNVNYLTSQTNNFDRQVAYASDVVYATNDELCFDYLKDNMVYDVTDKRQQGFDFAIVDEADSILVDEAQIPLVISTSQSSSEESKKIFAKLNKVIGQLQEKVDFKLDKKNQTIFLTIKGIKKIEKFTNVENLYHGDQENSHLYYVECLLKAHFLFKRGKDYILEDDKVVIVNEFTGRLMPNHRYYQGIHQAIEIKENLEIKDENETLALTTYQHFFRQYKKMSGFTGTARTAEKEFRLIYGKKVTSVPTNRPIARKDSPDRFFVNWEDKINYLSWILQGYFFKKRAALIGTRSVNKSGQVQEALAEENIPSNVLNAKHTDREAEIVSQAGQSQTMTVATNMAGRGTDIELASEVKDLGGLIVYGTERHNARRIDNQLIGRAGRQGDPGQTQFLISADDSLIRSYFRKDYEKEIKKYKNIEKGVESKKLERLLSQAQKRVESAFLNQRILNFEFDKVLERQRQSFYRQRERILQDENLKEETLSLLIDEVISDISRKFILKKKKIEIDKLKEIMSYLSGLVGNPWFSIKIKKKDFYSSAEIKKKTKDALVKYYEDFEYYYSSEKLRKMEKIVTLKVLDLSWSMHLKDVEQLQESVLISSLGKGNFFEDYRIRMSEIYKKMLRGVPEILCQTFFKTVNRLWKDKNL
jgi:preprotein translocase subunit SecA